MVKNESSSTVADFFSSEQDFSQPISARFDFRLLITETFIFKSEKNPKSSKTEKSRKFEFWSRKEVKEKWVIIMSHRYTTDFYRLTPLGILWFYKDNFMYNKTGSNLDGWKLSIFRVGMSHQTRISIGSCSTI